MKKERRTISSLIGRKTKRRKMNVKMTKMGLIPMPKRGWTMMMRRKILITIEN